MNDKFLEILSKSSGRTITRPYDGSLLIKLDLSELEKFAELIVKECANVAADHDALDIYEEIREHFEVEEWCGSVARNPDKNATWHQGG